MRIVDVQIPWEVNFSENENSIYSIVLLLIMWTMNWNILVIVLEKSTEISLVVVSECEV